MDVVFWCLVLTVGVVLVTRAHKRISRENTGHRLPVVFGEFAVQPSPSTKRQRRVAAVVAFVGVFGIVQVLYDMGYWGTAAYGFVGLLLLVYTVPATVVSILHNRRTSGLNTYRTSEQY